MCAMNEVSKIANSVLLLPIKIVNDRSCFEKGFQDEWSNKVANAVSDLTVLIRNCTFLEEEWAKNSQELLPLLILCGEHSVSSEWNSQKTVNNVKDLLQLLLSKLHFQTIQDIFALEGVACFALQQLKPKLGKNQIKQFPAAVNCFIWVITNTMLPAVIDESIDFAVPVSLVLFDDWEPEYQKKGLECLQHILNLNPKSLLQRGWIAVIFSALKKNVGYSDKLSLYKCLDICLKAQNSNPDDPQQWNQDDQYDSLASDVLNSMIIQDSSAVVSCNLKILTILFHSMKIKMAKFLPSIISLLDNYVTVGVSSDVHVLATEITEQMIEYCWVCLDPQFTNQLTWILFKLAQEKLIDEATKMKIVKLQEMLKSLSTPSTC
uniref:Uncharacterized protein n=1 Tax=Daphnia galeata TaxID=27404 RepID=A0A8J2WJW6_9CRUS|nr:unnamed protein product [Daphnia galeata]